MKPGSKVLYLGGASGTTVSHVADLVGPEGTVYAVEFSKRSGRDLVNMAKKRTNVIPIIEDARHPNKYRMLMPMVDVIFAYVAQPDHHVFLALTLLNTLKTEVTSSSLSRLPALILLLPQKLFLPPRLRSSRRRNSDQLREFLWSHMKEIILLSLECSDPTQLISHKTMLRSDSTHNNSL